MKQEITRKDGIVYERKNKTRNYDSNINIRVSRETLEELKKIAAKLGVKYNSMVRGIIEDFVEKEK
jgi:predicted DNA binding CopG/RHH family protein